MNFELNTSSFNFCSSLNSCPCIRVPESSTQFQALGFLKQCFLIVFLCIWFFPLILFLVLVHIVFLAWLIFPYLVKSHLCVSSYITLSSLTALSLSLIYSCCVSHLFNPHLITMCVNCLHLPLVLCRILEHCCVFPCSMFPEVMCSLSMLLYK